MKPFAFAIASFAFLAGSTTPVAAADTNQPLKILVPAVQSRTPGSASAKPDGNDPSKASADSKVSVEGWTLTIRGALLRDQPKETETAVELLRKQLVEIVRVVPALAVAKLRQVPLWFSPEYPGIPPRAEYHPGAKWLAANHRDPAMAKGVEFVTNDLEYFAESTEAYFSRNDFFPFNREELEKHDPGMAALLEKAWSRP